MFAAHRCVPAMIATAVLAAAPACASRGGFYRYPASARAIDDRAYRHGYDEGRDHGERDARNGRRFDYARHDDYRDADEGYRYGDRFEYGLAFRRGFVDGYNQGYHRYGRYGRQAYPPAQAGPYPYGGPDRYPAYATPGWQNGYRDGYEQGRSDARGRDRFDPIRSKRYRSGDHDYNRRYGPREDYQREYRAAFQQGYERGYRERW